MYAVIRTGGKQLKVNEGEVVRVEKLDGAPGAEVTLAEVLLIVDGAATQVGTPLVAGASVLARIVNQDRAKKVIIFKKRRRKGYMLKKGHRQSYTALKIEKIATATATTEDPNHGA